MSAIPDDGPWSSLSLDFYGPMKNGAYLLVLIDYNSRCPVVRLTSSTSFKKTSAILNDIFGKFGIPRAVRTDNGPPFNSYDFKAFAENQGFEHRRVTPLWPQANGLVERFMRNLGKVLRNAQVDQTAFESELIEFLRSYRATPHSSTKKSPNEMIFRTKSSTAKMPILRKHDDSELQAIAVENDAKAKTTMKNYADAKRHAKTSSLQVGDLVLLKQKRTHKHSTTYEPEPFSVVKINGSQIVIRRGDQELKRDTSLLKKLVDHQKPEGETGE